MKVLRILTIALILSMVAFQYSYIPFIKYFISENTLFAFSVSLGAVHEFLHALSGSTLMFLLILLNLSIGVFVSVFIYSPIEAMI